MLALVEEVVIQVVKVNVLHHAVMAVQKLVPDLVIQLV